MALTILEFWQQQLAIHETAQAATQAELKSAQAAQQAAAKQLATDLARATQLANTIAAQRARLAVTTVPADAGALLAEITAQVILQRALQGRLLDGQDAVDAANADAEVAAATLARTGTRIASVQAAIARAALQGQQRVDLKTALATPLLATLPGAATDLLASPTATHAASRLGKNFPAKLLALAGKRHDSRTGRLASLQAVLQAAEDAQGAGLAADAGLDGKVAPQRLAFERAQAALAAHVATAVARFARARAVLQVLEAIELDGSGKVPDVLSPAEKARLAALAARGEAAVPGAEAIDADLRAVFTAEDALATQVLAQIAADVDKLATDPALAAKRAAIAGARKTWTDAVAAFAAADKDDLDQWEAVVPDPAWKLLLDYQEGLADLNALAALDFAALVKALDDAEHAYSEALAAAELARRRADARDDAIARSRRRLDAARAAITNRLPSAIRGDSC